MRSSVSIGHTVSEMLRNFGLADLFQGIINYCDSISFACDLRQLASGYRYSSSGCPLTTIRTSMRSCSGMIGSRWERVL